MALAAIHARREPHRLAADDYAAIYTHSPDGILFTVPGGRVLAANPAACEILGLSEAEICGLGSEGLLVRDDATTPAAFVNRSAPASSREEVLMRRFDGSMFTAGVSSTIFTTSAGETRACVIFRDVSREVAIREELERHEIEMSYIVGHDELTKLLNRRGFAIAAEEALAFADREGLSMQLLFIDLDQLKEINDQLGHSAGDAAIAHLGHAIAAVTRSNDVAARIGGDEFVLLLAAATAPDVHDVIERIETFAANSGGEPHVECTVGIAERLPGQRTSLGDLLRQADQRLIVNKLRKRVGRTHRED
jgi:diguanylate cyclase (GGDEF)-like protein/PAS domain S-box-containing protein